MWSIARKKWEPRPEQIRGVELIVRGEGARLFLHPGKGKTTTVLKAFSVLKKLGYVDHLLVLAPLRVITTSWPSELAKWEDFEGLTYKIIHGQQRSAAMRMKADVYLMNYESLLTPEWVDKKGGVTGEALQFLRSGRFMLAVDESTKMKNSQSRRFKVMKKYLSLFSYRTIMTGTPKPNKIEDLFSQCYLTDEGKNLGKFITHFRHEYMQPAANGFGYEPQRGASERVAEAIHETVLQIDYEEAVPSQVVDIDIPMPDHVIPVYEELKQELITVIKGETVVAPNVAACLNKLRQLVQGAVYTEDGYTEVHEAKLDALENLIEELDGEPLFVLTQFRHDVERISKRLGYQVPYIGSGTSATQGAAHVANFASGSIPVLCAHPQSAAHGIDGLQNNCSNVCWFGMDWSWENYYQANLRIVRSGSKAEQVFIYRLVMDCPTERAVLNSVEGKKTREAEFLLELKKCLQVD